METIWFFITLDGWLFNSFLEIDFYWCIRIEIKTLFLFYIEREQVNLPVHLNNIHYKKVSWLLAHNESCDHQIYLAEAFISHVIYFCNFSVYVWIKLDKKKNPRHQTFYQSLNVSFSILIHTYLLTMQTIAKQHLYYYLGLYIFYKNRVVWKYILVCDILEKQFIYLVQ